ncbi:DUF2834 domain-containing protein [Chloroflexi bacterium TSY]|nr:DUF2834 domain-containing protein [Chloroflexi bacterium TSY]
MKPKHPYILLCILGTILPYSQFIPWLVEHGLDLQLLLDQIVSSRLALFGWLDVVVSAMVLFVFISSDGQRNQIQHLWLPILGTLTVGVSLGLPLYLLLRELRIEESSY